MKPQPDPVSQTHADQWIAQLRSLGVREVCLAPGSRSTPLALAVARCSGVRARIHYDERGLGFMALGLARAGGGPVAVVTTSGTAAANLLPAVVEAWHGRVPLILMTADRPPELRDNGANQSIDQCGLFGRHVRWFFDVPCPDSALPAGFIASMTAHAVAMAAEGPVHLNFQFREPFCVTDLPPFPGALPARRPVLAASLPSPADAAALAARIQREPKGLLVAGQMENEDDITAAGRLAHALGWPVAADLTSGMNRVGARGPGGSLDLALMDPDRVPRAGLCLHLGGRIVSKRLARYLATRADEVIRVAPGDHRLDPDSVAPLRVRATVAAAVESLLPLLAPAPQTGDLASFTARFEERLDDDLAPLWDPAPGAALTEVDAVRVARGLLQGECDVFVGNSMPVRVFDSLHGQVPARHARWFANRGASGIDGNLATLAGIAAAAGGKRKVFGFLGDLAALHDLSSLPLLARSPAPVALFVINNDGGGIFSHLPVRDCRDHFEPFFATPHGLRFEGVARMAGMNYLRAATAGELDAAAAATVQATRGTLVELVVDREHSRRAWSALLDRMRSLK